MKKQLIFICSLLILASCSSEPKQKETPKTAYDAKAVMLKKIDDLEAKVHDSSNTNLYNDQKSLMLAYQEFANKYNEGPEAAEAYFKAAEYSYAVTKYKHSFDLHQKVFESYPEFDKASSSLFYMGLICDHHLNDEENALICYEKVIELYPESMEASEARSSIKLLGMTDEQIIEKFQKMNGIE